MMWRALMARKRGLFQGEIPRFETRQAGVVCRDLSAFRNLFLLDDAPHLPVTVPHLLAAQLHMEIATHPDFPLPALGFIHVANHITQHRSLAIGSPFDLHVWVEGCRPTKLGVEFDLHTQASVDGVCCWEEVSTVLSRAVDGTGQQPSRPKAPLDASVPGEEWSLPASWGRDYAKVSGDWNPIHLYPWTARLFGFPRPIAHGMALLAKVVATLPRPEEGPIVLNTRFEKPVFLPGSVICQSAPDQGGHSFVLRGDRPHIFGWYGGKA